MMPDAASDVINAEVQTRRFALLPAVRSNSTLLARAFFGAARRER
jgi:hypothetical protein